MNDTISSLLKNKPSERTSITVILKKWLNLLNKEMHTLFWYCLSAFSKTSFSSSDLRICLIHSLLEYIEN